MKRTLKKTTMWMGIAALIHGVWLWRGSQLSTYDASTHSFFASHLVKHWFQTWNTGWYGGFDQFSYPPLGHQFIALLGRVLPIEAAYSVAQFFVLLYLFWGIYRFSLIWVSKESAVGALALGIVSSSVSQLVYQFGQFPMLFSAAFLLNACADLNQWFSLGQKRFLLSGVLCLLSVFLSHHFTFALGTVAFGGPVLIKNLLSGGSMVFKRIIQTGLVFFVVGLPIGIEYFVFTMKNPITQTIIPHGSRDHFLQNMYSLILFFGYPYGLWLLILPFALWKLATNKSTIPLACFALGSLVLGLGGTTPIARLVLGSLFDLITLERFAFWASLLMLPGIAWVLETLKYGLLRKLFWLASLGVQTCLIAFLFPISLPKVSDLDIKPVIGFLNEPAHQKVRYLTLGFGPKLGFVAAHTEASSIDGLYHFARSLPELRTSGIEALDGALHFGADGVKVLATFLDHPEKYKLGWVFSHGSDYIPLLVSHGWKREQEWNSVTLWAHPKIPNLTSKDLQSKNTYPRWVVILWGLSPVFCLLALSFQIGSQYYRNKSCRGQFQSAQPLQ